MLCRNALLRLGQVVVTRAEELQAIERFVAEGRATKLEAVSSPDLGRVIPRGSPYLAPVPTALPAPMFTGGYWVRPPVGSE
jgi:hypothetical protein